MIWVADIVSVFALGLMLTYAVRHYIFASNRLFLEQRQLHQGLTGAYLPSVSVLIPMHNEAEVAGTVIEHLAAADYPPDLLEIIAINDHSSDGTALIIDGLAARHSNVKVIHRLAPGPRGKPVALRAGTELASGEVLLLFDADYRPDSQLIKQLVAPFCDAGVAAVMGRVVPLNSADTPLTRLLDLERAGGYQGDQQARQNLGLIVQYGGTVAGVRRSVLEALGGWQAHLTEDTDLTFRIYLGGFKVVYLNAAECYEEVVPNWEARYKQLHRWAMGHNQCLFDYLGPTLRSPFLSWRQRLDGGLLLGVYFAPVVLLLGWLSSIYLYLAGQVWYGDLLILGAMLYNGYGNLAVFHEIGTALLLDGRRQSILLLPAVVFASVANVWICSAALLDFLWARVSARPAEWDKTARIARART